MRLTYRLQTKMADGLPTNEPSTFDTHWSRHCLAGNISGAGIAVASQFQVSPSKLGISDLESKPRLVRSDGSPPDLNLQNAGSEVDSCP